MMTQYFPICGDMVQLACNEMGHGNFTKVLDTLENRGIVYR